MARRQRSSAGMVGGIIFLLFMLLMGYIVFKAVSGVYAILAFVAPFLLIMALVLNHTVVTDFFKGLIKTLKQDTGKGLIYTAGTVIGYPFVAAWLAFRAYTKRGSKRKKEPVAKEDKEYIKYEEVEDEDFLELPDLEEVKQKPSSSSDGSYDDLFS